MAFLLGMLLVFGVSHVSALGKGKALFFDRDKTTQAKLPPVPVPNGFSVSYWVRFHKPGDAATEEFAGYGGSIWSLADESNDDIVHIASFEDLVAEMANGLAFFIPQVVDSAWHHHAFSYDNSTGVFTHFRDGKHVYNSTTESNEDVAKNGPLIGAYTLTSGHIILGNTYVDADTAFTGTLDEFCLWNASFASEETWANIMSSGCFSNNGPEHPLANLVQSYNFDVTKSTAPNLLNAVTNEYDGSTALRSICPDNQEFGELPAFVVSTAPFERKYSDAIIVIAATGTTNLTVVPCENCENITITSLPTNGTLRSSSTGTAVSVSDVISPTDLLFESSGTLVTGGELVLNYTYFGGSVTAKLLVNSPPVIKSFSESIQQNDNFILFVPPPGGYAYDLDGSLISPRVVSFSGNSSIKLYQFIDSPDCDPDDWTFETCIAVDSNEITSFPVLVSDSIRRLGVAHTGKYFGKSYAELVYDVSDGLVFSEQATITLDVVQVNQRPVPFSANSTTEEDTNILVDLHSEDLEGDLIFTIISSLPSNGKLYQALADGSKGALVTLDVPGSSISQWAESAIASSSWPDATNYPDQITGPADVFPDHGDLPYAWQPSVDGDFVHPWIELNYTQRVYLTSIDVYETWSPGSVVRVSAYYEENDSWDVVWEGESMIALLNPDPSTTRAMINTYALCPAAYPSNRIRLDLDLLSENYWVAVDAVSLSGTLSIYPNIVVNSTRQLIYEPNSNFNGADQFSFTVSDCPFYTVSRNLYTASRTATFDVDVSAVNDAPVAQYTKTTILDGPTSAPTIVFSAQDVDSSGLIFTVTSLPRKGKVKTSEGVVISSVPTTLANNTVIYVPEAISSKNVQRELMQIGFSVADAQGLSSSNFAEIEVQSCRFVNFTYTVAPTCSNSLRRDLYFAWPKAECVGYDLGISDIDCDHVPFSSGLGVAIVVISCLVICVCIGWIVWLSLYREIPIVRAAQYLFCVLFVIGAILLCVSCILSLGRNTDFLCMARLWFFHLPFTLMFGPLVMKIWRAYQILQNKTLQKRRITNFDILKWLLAMMAVDVLILILWSSISPLQSGVVRVEKSIGFVPRTVCKEANSGNSVFVVLSVIYKVLMCTFACFLSFQTRNVNPSFAESKHIMFAVYNTGLLGGLIAFVVYGAGINDAAGITLQSIGINFVVLTSVTVVLVPKYLARHKSTQDLLQTSNSPAVAVNQASSFRKRYSMKQGDNSSQQLQLQSSQPSSLQVQPQLAVLPSQTGKIDENISL